MVGLRAGVDEAGRGPVIGPMVIALVAGSQETETILTKLGVKDSKLLSRKSRSRLAKAIPKVALVTAIVIPPFVIDRWVRPTGLGLNELEAEAMAELLAMAGADEACVDALADEMKFAEKIRSLSGIANIYARHSADRDCPLASAASVVAKHMRDELVGTIPGAGSGYPSDPNTVCFLKAVGRTPAFVRKSWRVGGRHKFGEGPVLWNP